MDMESIDKLVAHNSPGAGLQLVVALLVGQFGIGSRDPRRCGGPAGAHPGLPGRGGELPPEVQQRLLGFGERAADGGGSFDLAAEEFPLDIAPGDCVHGFEQSLHIGGVIDRQSGGRIQQQVLFLNPQRGHSVPFLPAIGCSGSHCKEADCGRCTQ